MRVSVLGVGVLGRGLPGWEVARAVLRGEQAWDGGEVAMVAPGFLAPNERRRAGVVTRLALGVAQEAVMRAGGEPGGLRTVFGSSNGDGGTVHEILMELTEVAPQVSPTQFHNSVHNAAAGYWTIGHGARAGSVSVGCYDESWAGALLTAVAEVVSEDQRVLLVVYDCALPEPLAEKRPTEGVFGAAFVLAPGVAEEALAVLDVTYEAGAGEVPVSGPEWLREMAGGNPAARALPLLAALAEGRGGELAWEYVGGALRVRVRVGL